MFLISLYDLSTDDEAESPSADQSNDSIEPSDVKVEEKEGEKEEDERGAAEGGQTEDEERDVKENGRIYVRL